MIIGPSTWLQQLAAEQKWALYYIYFPKYNIYVTSFVPSLANVTVQ